MTHVEYFKRQAKNLFKDYKAKTPYIDKLDGSTYYKYDGKYFDVTWILDDYRFIIEECGWDEGNLSLMNIQHIFAYMIGFEKWADLVNASNVELELAKLRFDNQDKISLEEWDAHVNEQEFRLDAEFDPEFKLALFKRGLLNNDGSQLEQDYRLCKNQNRVSKNISSENIQTPSLNKQITSLPLNKEDRAEFIKTANNVFENVIERIEPNNTEVTRKLWDVENYIDNFLTKDMLPISRNYALSLIDAFLVHEVIGLATKADKMVKQG